MKEYNGNDARMITLNDKLGIVENISDDWTRCA